MLLPLRSARNRGQTPVRNIPGFLFFAAFPMRELRLTQPANRFSPSRRARLGSDRKKSQQIGRKRGLPQRQELSRITTLLLLRANVTVTARDWKIRLQNLRSARNHRAEKFSSVTIYSVMRGENASPSQTGESRRAKWRSQ